MDVSLVVAAAGSSAAVGRICALSAPQLVAKMSSLAIAYLMLSVFPLEALKRVLLPDTS
jgi:hypothetical protein